MEPLPLDDRGLAYGDGLFETVLLRDGQPLLWREHLARLQRGAERLGFTAPDAETLRACCAEAPAGLAVLKLIVTRGSGGRGYRPPAAPSPRLRWQLAAFAPQPERWRDGVRVRHCRLRLGRQPALAGIKHLNRLENVLARGEWQDDAIAEGLLSDSHGQLVEATCMNLFWSRQGRLESPRLAHCGVAGTLRDALLSTLAISEVEADPEALLDAEAVWLGNSLQGVWPLVQLDDAEGACLRRWTLDAHHRLLQDAGHALLGYPAIR
ncbi:aminodeoxychorismate lyase [Franzmannia qiaohouensis]|uniref:Aminodeoxychorismate lyase n=1 Tax=Franzmannia qiaohouensis TaxID=1329370 RepID=A0ABU1HF67_9GAMM|nr:aminodeoxychorismate lyase [Halomonas qiaohouensis]MDR5905429.1 aminodeoxychorismate lyase [Halomonas qiaohouensis]